MELTVSISFSRRCAITKSLRPVCPRHSCAEPDPWWDRHHCTKCKTQQHHRQTSPQLQKASTSDACQRTMSHFGLWGPLWGRWRKEESTSIRIKFVRLTISIGVRWTEDLGGRLVMAGSKMGRPSRCSGPTVVGLRPTRKKVSVTEYFSQNRGLWVKMLFLLYFTLCKSDPCMLSLCHLTILLNMNVLWCIVQTNLHHLFWQSVKLYEWKKIEILKHRILHTRP